jgi:hypothetical protein
MTMTQDGQYQARIAELEEALSDVRDLIEGYVDVNDGADGAPIANRAMRAVQLIDQTIGLPAANVIEAAGEEAAMKEVEEHLRTEGPNGYLEVKS